MKSYEFKRFYHNGRFVYKHKGSGIIVGNIFRPAKALFSRAALTGKTATALGKKALEAGASSAGEKLGKKATEKAGELIMKKLRGKTGQAGQRQQQQRQRQRASADMIVNRLISGSGFSYLRVGRFPPPNI